MAQPILEVADLTTSFRVQGTWRPVVRNLSFSIGPQETVAIVGESGSGKSVTALSIMRLTPRDTSRVTGRVLLRGRDLLALPEAEMRRVRGDEIAMIFQEPMTSLNPVLTIGFQIGEALILHRGMSRAQAEAETVRLLEKVRIPNARARLHDYPHHFSGGMRQRVMIAMALACRPKLLIADEPTTALDVTIQAQILDLMRRLRQESGAAIVLITHDLGVVAEVCDEVVVMYAGQVVERASVEALFRFPQHPYTVGLLGALPRLDRRRPRLAAIEGAVPNMTAPPQGCRFQARCPFRIEKCAELPPLAPVEAGHLARCWRAPLQRLVA